MISVPFLPAAIVIGIAVLLVPVLGVRMTVASAAVAAVLLATASFF